MSFLFNFPDGELYAAKSGLETIVNVVVPIVIGAGTLSALGYFIWNNANQHDRQRQKLYRDVEKIPAEQRPAVMQLLQDLREGTSRSSSVPGHHIDHLLRKYQP